MLVFASKICRKSNCLGHAPGRRLPNLFTFPQLFFQIVQILLDVKVSGRFVVEMLGIASKQGPSFLGLFYA